MSFMTLFYCIGIQFIIHKPASSIMLVLTNILFLLKIFIQFFKANSSLYMRLFVSCLFRTSFYSVICYMFFHLFRMEDLSTVERKRMNDMQDCNHGVQNNIRLVW